MSVGLNLSSYRISVIELIKSKEGLIIKNMIRSEVPSHSIVKGEIQDLVVLAKGLKDIWRKYRISDKKVFIGIANQKVIVKEIKIPVVDNEEINNSIKYQINDFIPIPKDNIIYDYFVMEKGEDFSRLMLVGAMKSMINDVVKSFKNAGLFAQAIDLNCFALYRTINYIHGLEKKIKSKKSNVFCVVNLGVEISIIEIVQDNNLKYPRFISASIKSFIDRIYEKTKKDFKYCEKIISEFDFKSLLAEENSKQKVKNEDKRLDKDNIENIIDNKDIVEIMKDTADLFIEEVRISVEHFSQENPKYKIGKIILTGEYIKNIDKYIEQEINYKVELLNIADYFSLKYLRRNTIYRDKNLNYLPDPSGIGMALRGLNQWKP